MASNIVKAVFKSGMNFSANIDGHYIQIDTDEAEGGSNLGPRPKVLMLLSLAGCTGFDVVGILNKMRVIFSDFTISVDGHLSETKPKIYDEVTINYTIKVDKADEKKVEKAVNLSNQKYCGVSKMFNAFSTLKVAIDYL